MNARLSFFVFVLFAFAGSASAQNAKATDVQRKPVSEPAIRLANKPATDGAAGATRDRSADKPAQVQSQSLRSKKKSGGGQTEDDLYVGVK